jgi:hypothetical protein
LILTWIDFRLLSDLDTRTVVRAGVLAQLRL